MNCYGNKFSDVYSIYKKECQTTMKQMQILRFFYFNDDF